MICAISVVNVLIKLYCFRSQSLPEDAPETYERDAAALGQALADCLSPVHDPNQRAPASARHTKFQLLDFTTLIKLREAHQTVQAEKGGRFQDKKRAQLPEESKHNALLRQYNEILKNHQNHGTSTGVERAIRWRHPAPGGREGRIDGMPAHTPTPGVAANAAEVATSISKKVSTSHSDL